MSYTEISKMCYRTETCHKTLQETGYWFTLTTQNKGITRVVFIFASASENQQFPYVKTKAQISCAVTALFFLNPKF